MLEHPEPDPQPDLITVPSVTERIISAWWECWEARRTAHGGKVRGFPRKRPTENTELKRCLAKGHTAEELILVVQWAFNSSDWHARRLRGELPDSRELFLGLSNLFRSTKVDIKIDKANTWDDDKRPAGPSDASRGYWQPDAAAASKPVDEDAQWSGLDRW